VTLTHDPKLDDPALDLALRSQTFYIAALGSRRTHASRLERLGALGHDAATMERIHGPAGIAIGAVSPAEIALSVMAEMTRVLRQEPGAGGSATCRWPRPKARSWPIRCAPARWPSGRAGA
jgi:xanthine dehydrogenase accessory factor